MAQNNTDTLNDPVKEAMAEARRNQILDAAVQVFAEKGFHRATIKDVAKAAGIADGTIYNYFKGKQDLLVAMVGQFAELNQLIGQVTQMAEVASPEQLLRGVLANRIDLLERNRIQVQAIMPQVIVDEELRTLFYEKLLKPNLAILEAVWQKKIEQGQVRPLDPHVMIQSILGTVLGLALLNIISHSEILANREAVIDTLVTILLHGMLSTDPAETAEGDNR
jgi:AcrR family transcriptional regulator